MIKGGGDGSAGDRLMILQPTVIWLALGAKRMGVLDTVIAGPPGARVWPPMMYGDV